jgi:protein-disulfide isomerase
MQRVSIEGIVRVSAATLLLMQVAHAASPQLAEGAVKSDVVVVIYEDLQCPDCARFDKELVSALLPRYGDRVAFVHKDFPLVRHEWARRAATASRYFEDVQPSLGLVFRREVMAHNASITQANLMQFIQSFASRHNVDPLEAARRLVENSYETLVQSDCVEGVAKGVQHTPTVIIRDKHFVEKIDLGSLTKVLDEALLDPRHAVGGGEKR